MSTPPIKSSKLRIAVIGCGDHVREDLLPPLALNHRVALSIAIDPSKVYRDAAATAFSIPESAADFSESTLRGRVDAVIVAGPPSLHERVVQELCPIGLDLLIEKPPSLSLENLRNQISIADENSTKVIIGHNFRHSLAYNVFKTHVLAMRGRAQLAEVSYHASLPVGRRWGLRQLESLLLSHFGHIQDLIADFFPWTDVRARLEANELPNGRTAATISINFADGAIAVFSISSLAPRFVLSVRVTSEMYILSHSAV